MRAGIFAHVETHATSSSLYISALKSQLVLHEPCSRLFTLLCLEVVFLSH